jgi:hypothetical protein
MRNFLSVEDRSELFFLFAIIFMYALSVMVQILNDFWFPFSAMALAVSFLVWIISSIFDFKKYLRLIPMLTTLGMTYPFYLVIFTHF